MSCYFNVPHLFPKVTDETRVFITHSVQLWIRVPVNVYFIVMQIFLPAKKKEGKLFFLPGLLVKTNNKSSLGFKQHWGCLKTALQP